LLKVHIPSSARAVEEARKDATIASDALKLDSFYVLSGFCAIAPVPSRATAKILKSFETKTPSCLIAFGCCWTNT
jgi:hypothetical protein